MHISILTLFPQMFSGPLDHSIIGRAQKQGLVTIKLINLRSFATDRYGTVDDKPYGGGVGMILKVDVIDRALTKTRLELPEKKAYTMLLDAKGKRFTQRIAQQYTQLEHLIIVCGHYEGVDARVEELVDETVSIGDFVLTGGEIPALAIVDAVVRLIPKVIQKPQVTANESFSADFLEYPQYTRPEEYKGKRVPSILLSGNHTQIVKWRSKHMKKIAAGVTD